MLDRIKKWEESKMYNFQVEKVTAELVQWIKDYFEAAGANTKAVVGISGGKDSSVVATLCVKALGKDRVIGVMMPQGEQFDIEFSQKLCAHLGIENVTINIKTMADAALGVVESGCKELGYDTLSTVTTFNTPARMRMSVLYGVAGTVGGRVANTCNLSEDWVGYATKYGDGAGDFSCLMNLTVKEVKEIGKYLEVPMELVEKTPIDGLCGKSDEENLGFTYEKLDEYIRLGVCDDESLKGKIDHMRRVNLHKLLPMANFNPSIQTVEEITSE